MGFEMNQCNRTTSYLIGVWEESKILILPLKMISPACILLSYGGVLTLHVCTSHACLMSTEAKRKHVTGGYEVPCGC